MPVFYLKLFETEMGDSGENKKELQLYELQPLDLQARPTRLELAISSMKRRFTNGNPAANLREKKQTFTDCAD